MLNPRTYPRTDPRTALRGDAVTAPHVGTGGRTLWFAGSRPRFQTQNREL